MTRNALALVVASTMLLATGCAAIDRMTGMDQARELAQRGEPARAKVLEIWDTGMTLNEDPVVGMRLLVTPSSGEPYEVETKGLVPRLQVCQVQPGNDIAVRVDPADHARVSLTYAR